MTGDTIELLRSALADDAQLTEEDCGLLEDRHAKAREAWPGVEVPFALFGPYVMARLPESESVPGALAALFTDDLYLACACGVGDPAAIAAFETSILPAARPRLQRIANGSIEAEDLLQRVRQKLLVGDVDAEPRIDRYGGRGDLVSWVKVVAVREGLMAQRRRRPSMEDDEALAVVAGQDDPELDFMRNHYQGEFRAAFTEALQALEPAERNLLRYHLVDRLGIDRIAVIDGVHRATAARRLGRARSKLHDETRARLTRRLHVEGAELESILRLVRSRLEVSVRRLLVDG